MSSNKPSRRRPAPPSKLRLALLDWLSPETFDIEITLTFKRRLMPEDAQDRVEYFWRTVDEFLFSRSQRRRGECCLRACFIETGTSGNNVHYHIAAKIPKTLSFEAFRAKLALFWSETHDAGLAEFKPIRNQEAFLRYITKKVTALQADAFDTRNTRLGG